jgi:Ran GTPase-activating protein (RanGAP) involved in mRNA processing and transport
MSDTRSIPRWLEEQCFRLRDEGCNLRDLNLNIRRLDPIMMEFFSEALKDNTRIESVNMTSSLSSLNRDHTDKDILTPLANAIRRHVSLKILHLSYNQLKDATPLGANLDMNQSSLKELYLDHNKLDNNTVVALARVIRQNETLTVLQLNYNNIGDEGGKIIADALKDNTCLKTLGLAHNSLKSESASSLLRSLECNRNVTLVRLFLGDNPEFPKSLERTISYLVQANGAGRYLLRNDDGESKLAIVENDKKDSDNDKDKNEKIEKTNGGGGGDSKRRVLGLWPLILQRSEPDMVYFFLVQKPSLVRSSGLPKRKRAETL